MKILFVTPGLWYGGAERVMSLLANEFVLQGIEVGFIIMDSEKKCAYNLNDKINVYFVDTAVLDSLKSFYKIIKQIRCCIKDYSPDMIISFFNSTLVFSKIASLGLHIPHIFSERNDPYNNIKGLKAKTFQWLAMRIAKKVVFQSHGAQAYYGQEILKKSCIILNPFDPSYLKQCNSAKTDKTIISVGRLCAQKNQYMQIEAFKLIKDRYPEYKLLIFGEGPLRQKLQSQIDRYQLSGRVILKENSNNIFEELEKAEIFILTSDYEGMPNVLIEAMAMGLPCISTDYSPGGAREFIQNGKNGCLIECGNSNRLAETISELIDNKKDSMSLSKEAQLIINLLDSKYIANQWIRMLISKRG